MNDPEKISTTEKAIRERMSAGLTRAQAEQAQAAQDAHDAQLAEAEKAAAAKKK